MRASMCPLLFSFSSEILAATPTGSASCEREHTWGLPSLPDIFSCIGLALRSLSDQFKDSEDRHIQCDNHHTHYRTQYADHDRLNEASQRLCGGFHFLVVELGNFFEHL